MWKKRFQVFMNLCKVFLASITLLVMKTLQAILLWLLVLLALIGRMFLELVYLLSLFTVFSDSSGGLYGRINKFYLRLRSWRLRLSFD